MTEIFLKLFLFEKNTKLENFTTRKDLGGHLLEVFIIHIRKQRNKIT